MVKLKDSVAVVPLLFLIVRVELVLYGKIQFLPPVAEPLIVEPLGPHALSASPSKLKPMLVSVVKVKDPLVAASAGSVIAGSIVSTVTTVRSSDTKRLPIRFFIPPSSCFSFSHNSPFLLPQGQQQKRIFCLTSWNSELPAAEQAYPRY